MQEVYSVLYEDERFLLAFHSTLGSTNVAISGWEAGKRLSTFELQMSRAPAVITSVLGTRTDTAPRLEACLILRRCICEKY